GQTSDIQKRLSEHNLGLCKSTKSRIPFELVYKEAYKTRGEAMNRERELKSGKGRDYINKVLNK
ncbi:MAG: GIY-YIG nuclease family protein, partial [Ignavibacteria bacterium]